MTDTHQYKNLCDCGCNEPTFITAEEAIEFLAHRLNFAGVSDVVAKKYARDLDAILPKQLTEPVAWMSDSPTKGNGKNLHWTKASALKLSSSITPLYAAPPAPPWIRAVDEELVSTHLGIADSSDDYETAKKKLNALISWHVGVATNEAFIPRISVDEYTKLAHRICSEYHHYDDRTRRAYTFEAHTLEQFVHAIENEVRKKYSNTTTPSDFVV